MQPTQLQLCSICRSATTSLDQLKALTGKGVTLCRGPRATPSDSSCDLRKISWDCIDAFNARLKSDYSAPYRSGDVDLSKKYTITAVDPELSLRAWNGPKEEGREWYDVDQLYLQYGWGKERGGGFSDVMIFDVYAVPDDPASRYITTRPINPDVDSEAAYEQIRTWLSSCKEDHPNCPKSLDRALPTRVLDVGPPDGSQEPKIYITKGEAAQYLVLSYCWGGPQPVTLTLSTLTAKATRIEMSSLPQSLQDAVKVTRKLGLRYIWIDALCIIQDSTEDKNKELKQMAQIYQNGLLTISAASARSVLDGFLLHREDLDTNVPPFALPYCSPKSGFEAGSIVVQESHHYDPHSEPINQRAWTLQERLLSPRVLIYGNLQLMWQCQTEQLIKNGGVKRKFLDSGSERLNAAFFAKNPEEGTMNLMDLTFDWIDVVTDYTHRSLSFADDKLTAIAAIASEFRKLRAGDDYLAGLWRSSLIMELMWMVPPPSAERMGVTPTRPVEYRAPSWSWAAIDGPVAFGGSWKDWPEKLPKDVKIIRCETTLRSNEVPTGNVVDGFLEIHGRAKRAFHDLDSHDIFDREDAREHPIFKAYIDAEGHKDEDVYCLKLQGGYGVMLRKISDHYQRVGFYEMIDRGERSSGWFDNHPPRILVIR